MMKRLTALFLCLCITLTAVLAVAEPVSINLLAEPTDYSEAIPKYVIGAVNLQDTLYILTTTTVERWQPGETATTVVFTDFYNPDYLAPDEAKSADAEGKPGFNKIIAGDDAVYGLNRTTGSLWKLADANGALAKPELAVSLSWDTMNRHNTTQDYDYTPQFGECVMLDGALYMTMTDWETDEATYEVCSWDMKTGAVIEDKKDVFMRTLAQYKDGLLIGKFYDEANSWDEETQSQKMPQIATYNPKTGEIAPVMDMTDANLYGVRYDAATDSLYYVLGATLYRSQALQTPGVISAYLPNRLWEDASVCLLPGGMVVVADGSGVFVRQLNAPGIENGALTIYGEYGSSGHQAYVSQNPQALVTCSETYFSSLEEFTNAMVSGTSTVDVLRLNSDYSPLSRLITKGYALDLSAYPELVGLAATMDPNLTAPCMKDGKLYGIPVEASAYCPGYNATIWKELGLTEDDLPKNMMEFMDFIANWQADYGEDHPEYMLIDTGSIKAFLMDWITQLYMANQKSKGEAFAFDTDLFRSLMQKFESIDFTELEPEDGQEDEEFWSRSPVFTGYNSVTYPGQFRYDYKYFPLPLADGMDPVIPANVGYMIINPRSTHIEQAVQYLNIYAQNLETDSANIVLFPGHNDPVENPSYETDRKNWQQNVDDYTASLTTAKEEEKASLQESIDYFTKMLSDDGTYRYNVSAEEIAFYRESIAPHLVILGETPFNVWGNEGANEFYTIRDQYLQGAMKLDAYIKETDKRLRMMQLEDQ